MHYGERNDLTSDEKTWAMGSHLGGVAAMVFSVGSLGWIVPLVIWLVKRSESKFVAFHALQQLFFQLLVMGIVAAGWAITGLLCLIVIGFVLIPVMIVVSIVLPVGSFVYSIVAAIKANNGEWYQYPIVGQWALKNVGV